MSMGTFNRIPEGKPRRDAADRPDAPQHVRALPAAPRVTHRKRGRRLEFRRKFCPQYPWIGEYGGIAKLAPVRPAPQRNQRDIVISQPYNIIQVTGSLFREVSGAGKKLRPTWQRPD